MSAVIGSEKMVHGAEEEEDEEVEIDLHHDNGGLPSGGSSWADVLHMAEGGGRQLHMDNKGDVTDVPDERPGTFISWRTMWAYTGPGFLVCIAYLDPGNIEADLQTGAYTGYQLVWVLLASHVLGLLLQSLAARLGCVTGTHLADICRTNYPKPAAMLLWAATELAIIGSDIQEVLGSAIGLQILLGIPLWAGCLVTALDTFTFLFMHVFGVRKLEALFVFLVAVMTVSFFVNSTVDPPPTGAVVRGFVPDMEEYALVPALALIGAVIMPHNIYLHSALVLSRSIDRTNPMKVREACKYTTLDSGMALLVAFLINMAVVCTFAVQFYAPECAHADTISACLGPDSLDASAETFGECVVSGSGGGDTGFCQEIGLTHAGDALRGSLGQYAKYVWAVGLLAAGQSSTMTGTYAGQFVMEGFLNLQIPQWQRLLLTRCIALVPALVVTISLRGDNTATDNLSEWINVLQSVQLPFALIPLLHFCGSRRIMGEYRSSTRLLVFTWLVSLFVICVNIYTVANYVTRDGRPSDLKLSLLVILSCVYVAFCIYLVREDAKRVYKWAAGEVDSYRHRREAIGSGYVNLPSMVEQTPSSSDDSSNTDIGSSSGGTATTLQ